MTFFNFITLLRFLFSIIFDWKKYMSLAKQFYYSKGFYWLILFLKYTGSGAYLFCAFLLVWHYGQKTAKQPLLGFFLLLGIFVCLLTLNYMWNRDTKIVLLKWQKANFNGTFKVIK